MTKSHKQSPNARKHPVCFKCQRPTRQVVQPIELVVYVRCEECGYVWSIPERRAPGKRRESEPSSHSSAPKTDVQTTLDHHRTQIEQQHNEDWAHYQHRFGRY